MMLGRTLSFREAMFSAPYEQLLGPDTIRLLSINPAESQKEPGRIEGSLQVVSIGKAPSYQALSYTWGDGVLCEKIYIDGQSVPITRNLRDGLLRVRHPNQEIHVWVDALSIRQDDPEEKTQQVSIIGRIFAAASLVIVWLGEHAHGSERLFQSPPTHTHFGCHQFLMRAYWKRTWVVQEIAAARSVLIQCGPDNLSWAALEKLLDPRKKEHLLFPAGHLERYKHVADLFQNTTRFDSVEYDLETDSPLDMQDLFELVEKFRNTECQDRRDKVYALLSLLGPGMTIEPDYTSSPAELFVRVCIGGLEEYQMVLLADILDLKHLPSFQAILDYILDEDLLTATETKVYAPGLVTAVDKLFGLWKAARKGNPSISHGACLMASIRSSSTARNRRNLDRTLDNETDSMRKPRLQASELSELFKRIPSSRPLEAVPELDARQSAQELLHLVEAELATRQEAPSSEHTGGTIKGHLRNGWLRTPSAEMLEDYNQIFESTRPYQDLRHLGKGVPTLPMTIASDYKGSPIRSAACRSSITALREITERPHATGSPLRVTALQALSAALPATTSRTTCPPKHEGAFSRVKLPAMYSQRTRSHDPI